MAERIKLVGLDVDGVLTDGGLYIGLVARPAASSSSASTSRTDSASKLLRTVGLRCPAIVSGRDSEATDAART